MTKHLKLKFIAISLFCTIAVVMQAQTFTTLASFDQSTGANPTFQSLVQGRDGNFYGTATARGANNQGTVFKINSQG